MIKLYCIREIKDPRNNSISFDTTDTISFYDNIRGTIREINDVNVSINTGYMWQSGTDEEKMLINKKFFFEALQDLKSFKIKEYFVTLAEYRDRQIDEILND